MVVLRVSLQSLDYGASAIKHMRHRTLQFKMMSGLRAPLQTPFVTFVISVTPQFPAYGINITYATAKSFYGVNILCTAAVSK